MQQQAERSGSGMPAQPLQRASRSNSFTSAISQLAEPGAITRSASHMADPQVGPCRGGGAEQGHGAMPCCQVLQEPPAACAWPPVHMWHRVGWTVPDHGASCSRSRSSNSR